MRDPARVPSIEARAAALTLALAAWNASLGDEAVRVRHRAALAEIGLDGAAPLAELRGVDTAQLVDNLLAYKRAHFPDNRRRIVGAELDPAGKLRVLWTQPDVADAPKPRRDLMVRRR